MRINLQSLIKSGKTLDERAWNTLVRAVMACEVTATSPLTLHQNPSGGSVIGIIRQPIFAIGTGGDTQRRSYYPFEVYSVPIDERPDPDSMWVRVNQGFIFRSPSDVISSRNSTDYNQISTTYPVADGGSGPFDLEVLEGDNWVYLDGPTLAEYADADTPFAAKITQDFNDTINGIVLAFVEGILVGPALTVEAYDQWYIGDIFMDKKYNLQSNGRLVGYNAQLTSPETGADISVELVAGTDPTLTMTSSDSESTLKADLLNIVADSGKYTSILAAYEELKNNDGTDIITINCDTSDPAIELAALDTGKYTSIKRAYVEMKSDDTTQLITIDVDGGADTAEIVVLETSGKYTSLKAAYQEMKNDAGDNEIVINCDTSNPVVSLSGTSGKYTTVNRAYMEMKNDDSDNIIFINADTDTRIELDATGAGLGRVQIDAVTNDAGNITITGDTNNDIIEISAGGTPTGVISIAQVSADGVCYMKSDGQFKVQVDGSDYFDAIGGDLFGAHAGKTYSLVEVDVCVSGTPMKMMVYGTAPY